MRRLFRPEWLYPQRRWTAAELDVIRRCNLLVHRGCNPHDVARALHRDLGLPPPPDPPADYFVPVFLLLAALGTVLVLWLA